MSHDEDVIPLSRFRAALARARRGRRAEALISEPEAARLVPRVPVQELYYAIQEVGLADARELLALATPEQVQGLVDLDVWERDHLDEARLGDWLEAVADAGPAHLARVVDGLDAEVVTLYFQRQVKVYDLTLEADAPPGEPMGHFYPTPDGFFLLDVLPPGEAGKRIERLVDHLYRADPETARRWVMAAKWELGPDLEEHSYRFRTGRMADLGYPEYYEALSIYRFLDPASVRLDEGTARKVAPSEAVTLPVQLAAALDEQSFFARALAEIHDPAEIERLQGLLLVLVNRAMAADRVDPADLDGARATLERTVGYLGLGLSYLAREEVERAGRVLGEVALERVFRVGFSLTLQLQRLARTLDQKGFVRLRPGGPLLYEPPFSTVLEALARPRPEVPRGLAEPDAPEGALRPFRALSDVRAAAQALEEASRIGPLVAAILDVGPEALREAALASIAPETEIRFGTLVRTAAAQLLLDRPLALKPVHPRELRALAARLENDQFPAAVRARLDQEIGARLAAQKIAAPSSVPGWPGPLLDRWLEGFGAALARPGGLLVRYSWLK